MSLKRRPRVLIVGTSHPLQMGMMGASLARAFHIYLKEICERSRVRAVAEELSEDALREKKVKSSVGMRLARNRRIPHRLCDPGNAERRRLGIADTNNIDAIADVMEYTAEQRRARHRAEYAKRERYWMRQLKELNRWPTLFICGMEHVQALSKLLRRAKIATTIEADDWPVEDI